MKKHIFFLSIFMMFANIHTPLFSKRITEYFKKTPKVKVINNTEGPIRVFIEEMYPSSGEKKGFKMPHETIKPGKTRSVKMYRNEDESRKEKEKKKCGTDKRCLRMLNTRKRIIIWWEQGKNGYYAEIYTIARGLKDLKEVTIKDRGSYTFKFYSSRRGAGIVSIGASLDGQRYRKVKKAKTKKVKTSKEEKQAKEAIKKAQEALKKPVAFPGRKRVLQEGIDAAKIQEDEEIEKQIREALRTEK